MYLTKLFKLMADKQASDLFISQGAPINIKIQGTSMAVNSQLMDDETIKKIAYELMSEGQQREFEETMEMNLSYMEPDAGNFRVNVFRQRGSISLVIRYVRNHIPSLSELKLPVMLESLIMEKRGLLLVVGATGSGKSTTLASMIEYRNNNVSGHILTIEDPIEFLFKHKKCIINQREVGIDTLSYSNALANALREAPDLMMVGEIRDRETLQHALIYAQTGHLCLSTMHANNSYHAMNRIMNFFPHDARDAVLSDLSMSLKAVVSQRLVRDVKGHLVPAVEIMLNSMHIAELIKKGDLDEIKEAMEQSLYPGSTSFEQALFKLYSEGKITFEEALHNSDSPTNLSWLINNSEQLKQNPVTVNADGETVQVNKESSFDFVLNTELLDKHD